jgi:hypothetical protein
MVKKYLFNLLISVDQLVNAVFGGDPDETISSRLGRNYPNTWFAKFVDVLFFWQTNHTKEAIESDEGKDAVVK